MPGATGKEVAILDLYHGTGNALRMSTIRPDLRVHSNSKSHRRQENSYADAERCTRHGPVRSYDGMFLPPLSVLSDVGCG